MPNSPDMPMLPPDFASRLDILGSQQPGNVDDRRGFPESGYQHMLAGNQMIHGIMRAIFGYEPFGDYPVKYARQPTGGQLQKDAGVNDIVNVLKGNGGY